MCSDALLLCGLTPQIEEEAGVVPLALAQRGILTFVFDDQPRPWEVHGE